MKKAIFNRETLKIELHFDKADYLALSDAQKSNLKSFYLWSSRGGCWVSRCKEPNLSGAKRIASDLGFGPIEKTGERLTFAEQVERTTERAEARAERYEAHAANAADRAEKLQKPMNDHRGDVAFFTQPNINTGAGRSFTRFRERVYASFERGCEEYRKSSYWKDRAATARETAAAEKYNDKAYLERKIKECKLGLKHKTENLDHYNDLYTKLINGQTLKKYDGTQITAEMIEDWAEETIERAEAERDKLAYLFDRLEELGGIQYGPENIKPGYIVSLGEWYADRVEVVSTGKVNFKGRTERGSVLEWSYAYIKEVIEAKEAAPKAHPFRVGDTYTVSVWNGHSYAPKEFKIIKATDKTVTLQSDGGKPFIRKPSERPWTPGEWLLSIVDSYNGYVTKRA